MTDVADPRVPVALLSLDRIADGGFAEAEVVLDGDAESLLLFRDGAQVRGWLNVCPHAGRRLDQIRPQGPDFLRRDVGCVRLRHAVGQAGCDDMVVAEGAGR